MPVLALFDVDGTLTAPRKKATNEMLEFMQALRKVRHAGIGRWHENLVEGVQTQVDDLLINKPVPSVSTSLWVSWVDLTCKRLPSSWVTTVSASSFSAINILASQTQLTTVTVAAAVLTEFDYVFSENGLVAHKAGALIARQSLKDHIGEQKLKELVNFVLHYIADLDIPIKRGTFIEFRSGMLNVSPIGRNCSQVERDEFEKYDETAGVR